jgi:hypothetical protein
MYTVDDVVEILGISRATVYNKMKDHEDMIVYKEGRKLLTAELIDIIKLESKRTYTYTTDELIKSFEEKRNMLNVEISTDIELDSLDSKNRKLEYKESNFLDIIEILKEQISTKDSQIEMITDLNNAVIEGKEREIERLHERLKDSNSRLQEAQKLVSQSQQLELINKDNIKQLESHFSEVDTKLRSVSDELETNKKKSIFNIFRK